MKHVVIFSFQFNGKEWRWERTFNSNQPIQETIDSYLEVKKLPFEIQKSEVNYKIKNAK